MILKDALKYYELTQCDFLTDLKEFGELQQNFMLGFASDDFTAQFEGFTDKLFLLWEDGKGGKEKVMELGLEYPSAMELIQIYCKTLSQPKKSNEPQIILTKSKALRKKKGDKDNQVLQLVSILIANEMDIAQFYEMELELIFKVIELVSDHKKKEREKSKRKGR